MKIIDTKGLKCPMPLIRTKQGLLEAGEGESLKILIDNDTSVKNVTHYLEDNGIPVKTTKSGDYWELSIVRGEDDIEHTKPEEYCETPVKRDGSYVVLFAKNRIGEGSNELGEKLIGSMLESLKAQEVLPGKIIFMNSGIQMVVNGSAALPLLVELELNGVEMIACGTCLNHFRKTEELAVGRISNMYEILEVMRNSTNVIQI